MDEQKGTAKRGWKQEFEEERRKIRSSNIEEHLKKVVKESGIDSQNWTPLPTAVIIPPIFALFQALKSKVQKRKLRPIVEFVSQNEAIQELPDIRSEEYIQLFTRMDTFFRDSIADLDKHNMPLWKDRFDRLSQLRALYPTKRGRNVERDFRHLYREIYERRMGMEAHKDFDRDVLLRVDLTFIPQELLDMFGEAPLLPAEYKTWLHDADGGRGGVRDMKGSMNFLPYSAVIDYLSSKKSDKRDEYKGYLTDKKEQFASIPGDRFELGGSVPLTNALLAVIRDILILQAGYDPSQVSDPLSWVVGFLVSKGENLQDPHIDYRWSAITSAQRRSRNHRIDPDIFPWSLDWPLTDGGLRLAFYGPDTAEGTGKPQASRMLHCPPGKALLWRGDAIHAGSLMDLYGQSGLRMHAYITLHQQQVSISNTLKPEIEWNDRHGDRYSEYLLKPDGSPYPKGNYSVKYYV